MNEELSDLIDEYRQVCRQFDMLTNLATQDNTSARIAYDSCVIGLQDRKKEIEHYLLLLGSENSEEKPHCLYAAKKALSSFKNLLHEAEIKIKSARPMPPFLY